MFMKRPNKIKYDSIQRGSNKKTRQLALTFL